METLPQENKTKHIGIGTVLISNFLSILIASGLTLSILFIMGLIQPNQTVQTPSPESSTQANATYALSSNNSDDAATAQEDLVVKTVEKANPAVVSIIISKDVPIMERYYEDNGIFSIPRYRTNGTEKKDIGGGSGFIVSTDGYIITNKHVVADDQAEYTVITQDNTKYTGKIIAKDPLNDIAILKIEADKDLPYLTFADSEHVKIGQSVIAIGTPLEFSNSVSVGVVSGLSRSIVAGGGLMGQSEHLDEVIQTDAAINPGNSGGPLLNLHGEVIGMNVAVANAENIGFSLPANVVKKVYESVKEHGTIVRPFLGVRYVPVTKQLKDKNQLSVDYGVIVMRGQDPEELAVIPGSAADKAGIVEGDIILEVDGKKLDDKTSLPQLIGNKEVGDSITLKVLHKGEERTVEVKLENSNTTVTPSKAPNNGSTSTNTPNDNQDLGF